MQKGKIFDTIKMYFVGKISQNMPHIPTNVPTPIIKKHTGRLYVTKKITDTLKANKLGGIMSGRHVTKQSALRAVKALQEEGIIHSYHTPSSILKEVIKKYEEEKGMDSVEVSKFKERREKRQQKRMKEFVSDGEAVKDLMKARKELEFKKKMRQKGTAKTYIRERQIEAAKEKRAEEEKKVSREKSGEEPRVETRIDF